MPLWWLLPLGVFLVVVVLYALGGLYVALGLHRDRPTHWLDEPQFPREAPTSISALVAQERARRRQGER